MTQEQMQQLAEREYPYPDSLTGGALSFAIINDLRKAFIKGLEMDRWIPVSEKLPTKDDADEFGEVDAWHIIGRCRCEVTLNAFYNKVDEYSHWQPITPPKPKSK